MKILLIYPQYTHSSEFDSRAPSMSLVYLASVLERDGHQLVVYDASLGPVVKAGKIFRYGVSEEEVYSFLRRHKFDIVGITCSFAARWRFVSRIAQQVKDLNPRVYCNDLNLIFSLNPDAIWNAFKILMDRVLL